MKLCRKPIPYHEYDSRHGWLRPTKTHCIKIKKTIQRIFAFISWNDSQKHQSCPQMASDPTKHGFDSMTRGKSLNRCTGNPKSPWMKKSSISKSTVKAILIFFSISRVLLCLRVLSVIRNKIDTTYSSWRKELEIGHRILGKLRKSE